MNELERLNELAEELPDDYKKIASSIIQIFVENDLKVVEAKVILDYCSYLSELSNVKALT